MIGRHRCFLSEGLLPVFLRDQQVEFWLVEEVLDSEFKGPNQALRIGPFRK